MPDFSQSPPHKNLPDPLYIISLGGEQSQKRGRIDDTDKAAASNKLD
jgi:hypothetical protein